MCPTSRNFDQLLKSMLAFDNDLYFCTFGSVFYLSVYWNCPTLMLSGIQLYNPMFPEVSLTLPHSEGAEYTENQSVLVPLHVAVSYHLTRAAEGKAVFWPVV